MGDCRHPQGEHRPGLTCDRAVVVIPWDPGQPHTPLSQVSELQVPGSVWPPWHERKKMSLGAPEGDSVPLLGVVLVLDKSPRVHVIKPQPTLGSQFRDHPLPSRRQGRSKKICGRNKENQVGQRE